MLRIGEPKEITEALGLSQLSKAEALRRPILRN